jgi:hypothetical protein
MLHNVANISADVTETEVVTVVADVAAEVVVVIMVEDTVTTHLRRLTIPMNVMYLQLTQTRPPLLNMMLQPLHHTRHHPVAAGRVAVVSVRVAIIDL